MANRTRLTLDAATGSLPTKNVGRWQHHVDYRPFKGNKLIRKSGVVIPEGVNNYGMVLGKKESFADARSQ